MTIEELEKEARTMYGEEEPFSEEVISIQAQLAIDLAKRFAASQVERTYTGALNKSVKEIQDQKKAILKELQ